MFLWKKDKKEESKHTVPENPKQIPVNPKPPAVKPVNQVATMTPVNPEPKAIQQMLPVSPVIPEKLKPVETEPKVPEKKTQETQTISEEKHEKTPEHHGVSEKHTEDQVIPVPHVNPDVQDDSQEYQVKIVPLDKLAPDPKQPRKNIDTNSDEIKGLAESIKLHGIINPITVRQENEDYIIIAGERRFIAAKIAGLTEVPVRLSHGKVTTINYVLMQLDENLQRQDLNAFEESMAYKRLIEEFGLQQKEIAEKIGKGEGYVSKMLKIGNIVQEIQAEIIASKESVAKRVLWELANLDQETQRKFWGKIKGNPTIKELETALTSESSAETEQHIETSVPDTEKRDKREKKSLNIEPETICRALMNLMKENDGEVVEYIAPRKLNKLIKRYGK